MNGEVIQDATHTPYVRGVFHVSELRFWSCNRKEHLQSACTTVKSADYSRKYWLVRRKPPFPANAFKEKFRVSGLWRKSKDTAHGNADALFRRPYPDICKHVS
ncbi:hypothetical protein NPIL_276741 [Nephila pilipes]|uniref:Uncharacterized protein n=1 Tax=Nephila pilipes TaxID=299642 RepID=A0A8X6N723_NEPPI|nr:hypothetical protein NPIL_276741 [Nephila pilipes]